MKHQRPFLVILKLKYSKTEQCSIIPILELTVINSYQVYKGHISFMAFEWDSCNIVMTETLGPWHYMHATIRHSVHPVSVLIVTSGFPFPRGIFGCIYTPFLVTPSLLFPSEYFVHWPLLIWLFVSSRSSSGLRVVWRAGCGVWSSSVAPGRSEVQYSSTVVSLSTLAAKVVLLFRCHYLVQSTYS